MSLDTAFVVFVPSRPKREINSVDLITNVRREDIDGDPLQKNHLTSC